MQFPTVENGTTRSVNANWNEYNFIRDLDARRGALLVLNEMSDTYRIYRGL